MEIEKRKITEASCGTNKRVRSSDVGDDDGSDNNEHEGNDFDNHNQEDDDKKDFRTSTTQLPYHYSLCNPPSPPLAPSGLHTNVVSNSMIS